MGKAKWIILGVVSVVVILLAAIAFSFLFSKEVPALLYVEQGNVQVEQGEGWQTAKEEMELEKDNSVKTLEDGRATIVLYDKSIVRLEENTEVSIAELSDKKVNIKQTSGNTWNKIEKLGGIEKYEITTPTTVATVRGTGFLVGINNVLVEEGLVNVGLMKDGKRIAEQDVGGGEKILVDVEELKLRLENLTEEEKARLRKHIEKDLETLKRVRKQIVKRDRFLRTIEKMYSKDEEKRLDNFFNKLDRGELKEEEITKKLPIKNAAVMKVISISKKIKEYRRMLNITNTTINTTNTVIEEER